MSNNYLTFELQISFGARPTDGQCRQYYLCYYYGSLYQDSSRKSQNSHLNILIFLRKVIQGRTTNKCQVYYQLPDNLSMGQANTLPGDLKYVLFTYILSKILAYLSFYQKYSLKVIYLNPIQSIRLHLMPPYCIHPSTFFHPQCHLSTPVPSSMPNALQPSKQKANVF